MNLQKSIKKPLNAILRIYFPILGWFHDYSTL